MKTFCDFADKIAEKVNKFTITPIVPIIDKFIKYFIKFILFLFGFVACLVLGISVLCLILDILNFILEGYEIDVDLILVSIIISPICLCITVFISFVVSFIRPHKYQVTEKKKTKLVLLFFILLLVSFITQISTNVS